MRFCKDKSLGNISSRPIGIDPRQSLSTVLITF